MTRSAESSTKSGRPVTLVPMPPGLWMILLGSGCAILSPLFGLLVGSTVQSAPTGWLLNPLYWGIFFGIGMAGIGVLVAAVGARRLWLHQRNHRQEEVR